MEKVKSLGDIGDDGLVIYDGDKFYYVEEQQWQGLPKKPVPKLFTDGAILAIPTGTTALHVNLDVIQPTPNPDPDPTT